MKGLPMPPFEPQLGLIVLMVDRALLFKIVTTTYGHRVPEVAHYFEHTGVPRSLEVAYEIAARFELGKRGSLYAMDEYRIVTGEVDVWKSLRDDQLPEELRYYRDTFKIPLCNPAQGHGQPDRTHVVEFSTHPRQH